MYFPFGETAGRKCEFAKVFVKVKIGGKEILIDNEWSWAAIAYSVSTGKLLIWA